MFVLINTIVKTYRYALFCKGGKNMNKVKNFARRADKKLHSFRMMSVLILSILTISLVLFGVMATTAIKLHNISAENEYYSKAAESHLSASFIDVEAATASREKANAVYEKNEMARDAIYNSDITVVRWFAGQNNFIRIAVLGSLFGIIIYLTRALVKVEKSRKEMVRKYKKHLLYLMREEK